MSDMAKKRGEEKADKVPVKYTCNCVDHYHPSVPFSKKQLKGSTLCIGDRQRCPSSARLDVEEDISANRGMSKNSLRSRVELTSPCLNKGKI